MKILEHDPLATDDPRHMTDVQLARLGVRMVDMEKVRLQCLTCGVTWTPLLTAQGTLPYGYWHCPQRCNV